MNLGKTLMLAIVSAGLVGCASNAYDPKAADTKLSAYAGQARYPVEMQTEVAPNLFAVVAADSTFTIYNAGDESITRFEIWVNKTYTLHIEDKLDARSQLTISPKTLFNNVGTSLDGIPASGISSIQIFYDNKLWTVKGPILPKA